jgi:hypothetical protein
MPRRHVAAELPADIDRTLSIVVGLAHGKVVELPNGFTIIMGTDMTIGFGHGLDNKPDFVTQINDMSLRQLNDLLTRHQIAKATEVKE